MIIRTAGREDITKKAGKVVDLMLSHHLRHYRWDRAFLFLIPKVSAHRVGLVILITAQIDVMGAFEFIHLKAAFHHHRVVSGIHLYDFSRWRYVFLHLVRCV